ncbi:MAG: cytochrome c peroxidase [Acidobacteriota bacterium]
MGARTRVMLALLAALWLTGSAAHEADSAPGSDESTPTFAAVQYTPVAGRPDDNLRALDALIARAVRDGADHVVLPELAVTGPLVGADGEPTFESVPTESIPGPTTEHFAAIAKRHGIWLVVPVLETASYGGTHHVTAVLLDDHGRILHTVRKIMPGGDGAEGEFVRGAAGTVVQSVDIGGRRVGLLFGHDLMVGVRRLADLGADVLLVPAGWRRDELYGWPQVVADIGREHRVSLVVATRQPEQRLGGVFPAGAPPVGATPNGDEDPGAVAAAQIESPAYALAPPASLGLPMMAIPRHSQFSPELVELGRDLFFDANLSRPGDMSCATCHKPEKYFADDRALSEGLDGRLTMRNVPSLLNVGYKGSLFWDGYVASLESQAKYPMIHVDEMDVRLLDNVEAYVRREPKYRQRLAALTHTPEAEITIEEVTFALASFQRTLVSGGSAFDRYYYGGETEALDAAARRGLALFQGRAACAECHLIGPRYALLTDQDFHITGVGYDAATGTFSDVGAGINSYEGKGGVFVTPSLRNVAATAPYMHDGSLSTLDEVVSYYDRGGNPAPDLDPKLRPLHLSPREKQDLVAFLRSLTGVERYSADGRLIVEADDQAQAAR